MSLDKESKLKLEKTVNWLETEKARLSFSRPDEASYQEAWLVYSLVLCSMWDVFNKADGGSRSGEVLRNMGQQMAETSGVGVARWKAARAKVRAAQVLGLAA